MKNPIGHKIIRYGAVSSTNGVLKKLAEDGVEPGTVVVAEVQERGRGRLQRTWESPKGGLWLSVLLDAEKQTAEGKTGLITLMAGCAVAEAISNTFKLEARVKWPNDVLIKGKKVCGILGEMVNVRKKHLAVIGIGVNVNNPVKKGYDFSPFSTSLTEELKKELAMEELEAEILCQLEKRNQLLSNGEFDAILEDWRKLADTLGKKVRLMTPTGQLEGVAKDIDENGSLLVKKPDGKIETVTAGDCEHLG
jgi:BirA family biotin operon repressor/biotin-[acetyl-CoA-carboxylase] ligase